MPDRAGISFKEIRAVLRANAKVAPDYVNPETDQVYYSRRHLRFLCRLYLARMIFFDLFRKAASMFLIEYEPASGGAAVVKR